MATIDIFYKTYHKDFKWLYKSLESMKKYCTGYNNICIVIPEREIYMFDRSKLIDKCKIFTVDERTTIFEEGYLFQQWVKMSAYQYCQSDFIMFADSDVLFTKNIDVRDIVKTKKPTILYTPYSVLTDAQCWKEPTDRFMNAPQEYEFMRRLPLTYHRSTLEKIHKLEPRLYEIIMASGRFSEFNAIGAWAFAHEKHKYTFVNTEDGPLEENYVEQFWSHSGINKDDQDKINEILK